MIQNKNKVILYLGIALLCILVFIITFTITISKLNNEHNNDNENIIENEEQENEEENNILKVIIDKDETEEKNETDGNNKIEENNTLKENNVKSQDNTTTSKAIYYIKVNNKANTVTIYKKDADGNFTIPTKVMVCSIGDYTPPCTKYPNASYITNGDKYKWATLEGHVYGQYATRIVGGILFHSVPYTDGWKNSAKGSLEYWEYDKLGTKASLGCVRLTVADAKWIYDNIGKGTTVEFYSDDNPGPLGKPTVNKISDYPDYLRKWDPTDPDKNNPWIYYVEPVNAEPTNTTKNEKLENTQTKPEENQEKTTENKEQNVGTNNIEQNNIVKNETTFQETNNTVQNNQTQNNTVKNNTIINNTITDNTVMNNTATGNSITNNTGNNITKNENSV